VADREISVPAELKFNVAAIATEHIQLFAIDGAKPTMKMETKVGSSSSPSTSSSSLLRRLLKFALPLPLLLVIVFGGLYLLCDRWHEALNDLGLLISPRLKHVRGAPPI